jgi:hypothetical protein
MNRLYLMDRIRPDLDKYVFVSTRDEVLINITTSIWQLITETLRVNIENSYENNKQK